jgi:hypothetical protein
MSAHAIRGSCAHAIRGSFPTNGENLANLIGPMEKVG